MFLNGEKLRKSAMKTQIIGTNKKNIKQTQEKEWGGADGERQKKRGNTIEKQTNPRSRSTIHEQKRSVYARKSVK